MLKNSRGILGGRKLDDILQHDIARYGFTHALRIPIATQASRPQLTKSLQHAMSDTTAANIHPAAFNPPGVYCITLGYLELETPDRVKRVSQFLKDLMLDRTLSEIIKSKSTTLHSTAMLDSGPRVLKPLRVSVSGLESYSQPPSKLCRLYAPVVDSTELLASFVHAVRSEFASAGFVKLRPYDLRTPVPLHVQILGNNRLWTKEANAKPSILRKLPKEFVLFRKARFDIGDFYTKFQNMTWASEFPLERLCIGGMQRFDIIKDGRSIDRGYEELASVPLPGIKQSEEDPFLKHTEYAKIKRIILDNNNVADTRDIHAIRKEIQKLRKPKGSQL
ncbi:hypothetical protein G7Y79_00034g069790 [Physcia stellaris]|nr:hypothetical protein G7Y79_00034g069790 [Physcia stellaris]